MIVAERKPFAEIKEMLSGYRKILILGCGTCVSVCMAGGEKETGILASQLRMAFAKENREVEIKEATILRQCDREYIETIRKSAGESEAVLSLACGAGVQFAAELLAPLLVLPGVNTRFIGVAEGEGVWSERCRACGDCVLSETAGICPITICAKSLLNGPCGGTRDGKCEVDKDKDCAWTLIYKRLEETGKLDKMRKIHPPKKHGVRINPQRQVNEEFKKDQGESSKVKGK
ncbi:MAG: methylenetetrahydrofolate reductase C-terminal domain-containing protein [bacterium]|nr:methylenetetrahydrofolate reductase C-terminal domain-containing protein [bacterium]